MIIVMFICITTSSFAQNTREQENRKARLEREIALIDKQLKDTELKSKDAVMQLSLIRKKISNRQELIKESDKTITNLGNQIAVKQEEVTALKNRFDTLSIYYTKLVKSAYKNRDAKIWYLYVLASENLGQAFRRIGYLKNLTTEMNIQAKKILETRAELEKETEKLQKLKMATQQAKNQRISEVESLQKEEATSQEIVNQLKKNRNKYQSQIKQKRREVEALNREIRRIIQAATNGKSNKNAKSKVTIDYKLDAEFARNRGKLPWPADGPIVEQYGQRYHPVFKNVKLPFSNGITIALNPNTNIRAIFDGVVRQIVVIPGYNKCVLIQHGNYFSFYCKMGEVNVKAGDKVTTSQVIGTVDTIDGSTQLHLEIWQGSKPNDPELWLRP